MKKIILCAIALMGLAGCSTISPYEEGCRDGVSGWNKGSVTNQKRLNEYCNDLDRAHTALQKAKASGNRP